MTLSNGIFWHLSIKTSRPIYTHIPFGAASFGAIANSEFDAEEKGTESRKSLPACPHPPTYGMLVVYTTVLIIWGFVHLIIVDMNLALTE